MNEELSRAEMIRVRLVIITVLVLGTVITLALAFHDYSHRAKFDTYCGPGLAITQVCVDVPKGQAPTVDKYGCIGSGDNRLCGSWSKQ